MASTSHPAFPTRPYSSVHGKHPERNQAPQYGAAAGRENIRLERERADRERANREAAIIAQQQVPGVGGTGTPMNGVSEDQREEINEAFALFDLDKNQRIDYHEFKVALKALGFDLPKSEILDLLTTHGIPSDTPNPLDGPIPPQPKNRQQPQATPGRLLITLPSFQKIASELISQRDPRDEIMRAFALFDLDDKGMISIEDLRRVAKELGEGLDDGELNAMIEEFDLDGKGGVGREEFLAICMGN